VVGKLVTYDVLLQQSNIIEPVNAVRLSADTVAVNSVVSEVDGVKVKVVPSSETLFTLPVLVMVP
jgi:hypothetical protein